MFGWRKTSIFEAIWTDILLRHHSDIKNKINIQYNIQAFIVFISLSIERFANYL